MPQPFPRQVGGLNRCFHPDHRKFRFQIVRIISILERSCLKKILILDRGPLRRLLELLICYRFFAARQYFVEFKARFAIRGLDAIVFTARRAFFSVWFMAPRGSVLSATLSWEINGLGALLMYIHVPIALSRPKRIADKQPQEQRILIFAEN